MSEKINVNIRIDKELKNKAKVIAEKKGTNLSTILNMYLISFVETWKIEYLWSDQNMIKYEELSKNDEEKLKNMPEFNSLLNTFSWI